MAKSLLQQIAHVVANVKAVDRRVTLLRTQISVDKALDDFSATDYTCELSELSVLLGSALFDLANIVNSTKDEQK